MKTRLGSMPALLPLLAVLFLGACGSTRILHANFNADMINSGPNPSPPGDPAGDEIYMTGAGVSGQYVVVNDAALNSKALKYANVATPVANRFLGFVSTPVSPASTNELWAIWQGVPNLTGSHSPLDIWLSSGHFQATARLRFKNGKISVQTPGGMNFEEIGSYTNGQSHVVIIHANKANQTYSVTITETGSPTISVDPRPILSPAAFNSNRPALFLQFSEETSGSGYYVVDDVEIRRKD